MRNKLRVLDSLALAAGVSAVITGASLLAAPELRRGEDKVRVLAGGGGMSLRPASAAERRRVLPLHASLRAGDGGGATIVNLTAWQDAYVESDCPADCDGIPCNAVILIWDEDPPAEAAVEVAVDDHVVGEAEAGQQVASLSGIEAGPHTFRVRSGSDGASSEATLAVLDTQPFGDPRDILCSEGAMDGPGTCVTDVTFQHPEVRPEYYAIYLDDEFFDTLPGDFEPPVFTIPGVSPGEHRVQMLAVRRGGGSRYLGCLVETSCSITCGPEGCPAPLDLRLCQLTYGDGPHDVLAAWVNPAPGYTGVRVFVDGNLAGDYPGETRLLRLGFAAPEARVGIQGTCDGGDVSIVTEHVLPLLARTPHPNPVTGTPTCVFAPDFGASILNWKNADPSDFIIVHVQSPTRSYILGLFDGKQTSIPIVGTGPEDVFHLQFFVLRGDACYGSELVSCIPSVITSNRAPVCNGSAAFDISSPIHLLDALFTRGTPLACPAACECDGNGSIDIADAICMLYFLFGGAPAPVTWYEGCRPLLTPVPCPGPVCDG